MSVQMSCLQISTCVALSFWMRGLEPTLTLSGDSVHLKFSIESADPSIAKLQYPYTKRKFWWALLNSNGLVVVSWKFTDVTTTSTFPVQWTGYRSTSESFEWALSFKMFKLLESLLYFVQSRVSVKLHGYSNFIVVWITDCNIKFLWYTIMFPKPFLVQMTINLHQGRGNLLK